MQTLLKSRSLKTLFMLIIVFFLAAFISCSMPGNVQAAPEEDIVLQIGGEGINNPLSFTRTELESMEQYQQVYSVINAWPTKKFYVGKGVKLNDLLQKAEMQSTAKLIKFSSQDGYTVTLTVQEILKDKRYYFPYFKDDGSRDGDGVLTGSALNAQIAEPIVALVFVEGSLNPAYMNDLNSPMLMLGQRAVTEQSGNLLVKYLNKIEVLNSEPPQWDKPQANPNSGIVPAGTMIALSSQGMDDDKIYYTTDGTIPNLDSLMYNKIAKRWWSARAGELGIHNSPVGPINENTVIKAVTIGPGKRDSEVVTFTYEVEGLKPERQDDTAPLAESPDNTEVNVIIDIQNHWAKGNIEKLIAAGSVSGYPDGTFKPDKTITRAEFASMLCNVFKFESKGSRVFTDTKEHWGRENISKAAAAGVVSGYDEETFAPDDLITREQMAVMIARAVNLPPVMEELNFSDSGNISAWAKPSIAAVNKAGFMKGYYDNTIKPQGQASRAEAVTVIINALPGNI